MISLQSFALHFMLHLLVRLGLARILLLLILSLVVVASSSPALVVVVVVVVISGVLLIVLLSRLCQFAALYCCVPFDFGF